MFGPNLQVSAENTLRSPILHLPTYRALGKSLTLCAFTDEPKVLEYFQLAVTRISKKHLILKVGLEYQVERYL